MQSFETDIAIIGAGLSGLVLAEALLHQGKSVLLLEAQGRVGGRVLSVQGPSGSGFRYDMGAAWIWPHNHRMLRLVERLGLSLIPQYASGSLVFQDASGAVRRDLAFSTMGGALRLEGGLARVPEAMASTFPDGVLRLNHQIDAVAQDARGVLLSGIGPDGPLGVTAKHVVLSLPPRLVAARIAFTPRLSANARSRLSAVPTWMAAQSKVVAVYRHAFWRSAGLSGDVISHRGPLAEIHDASPVASTVCEAALFGFVHASALPSDPTDPGFLAQVQAQLIALFGAEAANPAALYVKAWGQEPTTAVPGDRPDLGEHPAYRPIGLIDPEWRDRVFMSGTEMAFEHGGFLEGALEAAELTLRDLDHLNAHHPQS